MSGISKLNSSVVDITAYDLRLQLQQLWPDEHVKPVVKEKDPAVDGRAAW